MPRRLSCVMGWCLCRSRIITSFFGISCSRTSVPYGYLVRLRNGEAVLSDRQFADAASYWMEERYDQYLKSHSTQQDSGQEETEEPTQPHTPEGKSVYLCLRAQDPQLVEEALDALERYDGQATFYCSLTFLEQQGDLLRRMEASGQGIGILADSADPERSAAEQLKWGNELLYRSACTKTRLVYVENASERTLGELAQAGYCCLRADMDRTAYALTSTASAETLLQRVSARSGDVSVWLGESISGTGLRAFLQKAHQAGRSVPCRDRDRIMTHPAGKILQKIQHTGPQAGIIQSMKRIEWRDRHGT